MFATLIALIQKYILRRWLPFLIILVLAVYAFVDVAGDVWLQEGFEWDVPIMQIIHSFSTPALDNFFIFVTHTASPWLIIPFIAVCLWLWYQKQIYRMILLIVSVLGNGLINAILKAIFERPRPDVFEPLLSESSYSFPSGHTMAAVAFYGVVAVFLWQDKQRLAAVISGVWVMLVALSRVYIGVHYPSDVFASFALGVAWVALILLNDQRRAAREGAMKTKMDNKVD